MDFSTFASTMTPKSYSMLQNNNISLASTTPGNLRGAQNGKKIPNIGEKYKKHQCCEKDLFEAVFFRLSDIFRAAEINSAGWPETLGTLGPGGIKKGQK